jgi:hypothetical protein
MESDTYYVPSYDELPAFIARPALPGNEDYLCEVVDVEPLHKKEGYGGKFSEVMTIKMEVLSFADLTSLVDVQDVPLEPGDIRYIWLDIDPLHLGFMKSGVAAKARQFLLAVNDIHDMNARVPQSPISALLKKRVIATLIAKTRKDGSLGNVAVAFKPAIKRRRGTGEGTGSAREVVETLAKAADEDDYTNALTRAEEYFNEGDE